MNNLKVCSIVAISENYVIGKDNTLIWHIPEDLKHFKRTTMGKPIIMGRKSYEAIGKPLPGRPNIVVSRSFTEESRIKSLGEDGPFLYTSIEDGIAAAKKRAEEMGVNEIFITGGGEIYRQTLPLTQRLYLTIVHKEYEGDTVFPEFDWDDWQVTSCEKHDGDPAFTFYTLDRRL